MLSCGYLLGLQRQLVLRNTKGYIYIYIYYYYFSLNTRMKKIIVQRSQCSKLESNGQG